MEHYALPEFSTAQEFLCHLAQKTGKLKKGISVFRYNIVCCIFGGQYLMDV